MIPKRYIAEWQKEVPWSSPDQVEQDLIISRVLVTLFSDEFLRNELAFRGGTALHKLYLAPAPRYSEDIDLVRTGTGPIKPIAERIGALLDFFEEERRTDQNETTFTIRHGFAPEHENPKLNLKIEINCREQESVLGHQGIPFRVKNSWYSGEAELTSYELEELLGTKLRALYERKKGRDLFDLHYAKQHASIDTARVLQCYEHYVKMSAGKPPTKKQFLRNLEGKLADPAFEGDLEGLLRPGVEYDQEEAFEWVKEALIERME